MMQTIADTIEQQIDTLLKTAVYWDEQAQTCTVKSQVMRAVKNSAECLRKAEWLERRRLEHEA